MEKLQNKTQSSDILFTQAESDFFFFLEHYSPSNDMAWESESPTRFFKELIPSILRDCRSSSPLPSPTET